MGILKENSIDIKGNKATSNEVTLSEMEPNKLAWVSDLGIDIESFPNLALEDLMAVPGGMGQIGMEDMEEIWSVSGGSYVSDSEGTGGSGDKEFSGFQEGDVGIGSEVPWGRLGDLTLTGQSALVKCLPVDPDVNGIGNSFQRVTRSKGKVKEYPNVQPRILEYKEW